MGIELSGMNEMLAKLQKMDRDVTAVKRKAIMAGAEIIRAEAMALAPVDSGQLQRSISISKFESNYNGSEYVYVGPSAGKGFYGFMNEYGRIVPPMLEII